MGHYARFRRERFDIDQAGMETRLSALERRRWTVLGIAPRDAELVVLLRRDPTYFADALLEEWALSGGDWTAFIDAIARILIEVEACDLTPGGAQLTLRDPEIDRPLERLLPTPDPDEPPNAYRATLRAWATEVAQPPRTPRQSTSDLLSLTPKPTPPQRPPPRRPSNRAVHDGGR